MKLIWSSSLDRGIENLLYLYPFIKDRYPDTTLDIFYGFGMWFNEGERKKFKDEVMATIAKLPGVTFHGKVSQKVLHAAQMQADVWAYPTAFHETFCITAVENMLAKNLIVCSHRAGLIDTVGDRGILIPGEASSKEYRDLFLKSLFETWEDKEKLNALIEKAYQWALQQTWTNRAKEWLDIFGLKV